MYHIMKIRNTKKTKNYKEQNTNKKKTPYE